VSRWSNPPRCLCTHKAIEHSSHAPADKETPNTPLNRIYDECGYPRCPCPKYRAMFAFEKDAK